MKHTEDDLRTLLDAVWQVLDDMGTNKTSCCMAAKAQLRYAFEPFRDEELDVEMPYEEAVEIMTQAGLL